jgi:DNA-binding HxlR family transcriptional regulator
MAALDLLGRRWALRVLWELREGALTSRALAERCGGVSPTVLQARLDELRETGIVERTPDGYALSEAGEELSCALAPLAAWSSKWARRLAARARNP